MQFQDTHVDETFLVCTSSETVDKLCYMYHKAIEATSRNEEKMLGEAGHPNDCPNLGRIP